MAISTYSELKAALANWLHDDDLTDRIPEFIALGEARINSRLRIRAMESLEALETVAGTETVALPTRFKQAKWIYVDSTPQQKLSYMPAETLIKHYAGAENGVPCNFTYSGDNLLLRPIPGAVYGIYMQCWKGVAPLSDSNETNVILTNYPNLYLFAAMVEASSYVVDNEEVGKWEPRFNQIINELHNEDKKSRHSGSALAMRPSGITP